MLRSDSAHLTRLGEFQRIAHPIDQHLAQARDRVAHRAHIDRVPALSLQRLQLDLGAEGLVVAHLRIDARRDRRGSSMLVACQKTQPAALTQALRMRLASKTQTGTSSHS